MRPVTSTLARSLTSVSVDNGVAHITMDSPKTRNALSLEMMVRMTEDITRAADDKSVRSIVIRGQGTVFSAGHNLKEMTADMGYDYHMKIFDTCEKMMLLVNQVQLHIS